MSVLIAVEALVPTLEAHQALAAVVKKHAHDGPAQRPGMDERLKDAMACSKVPQHFASACNDRAKTSALHLAGAVWDVTQGVVRSGCTAAQAQYKAACADAPQATTAPQPPAPSAARKAWATLASGGAFVYGSSAGAYTLLGARGGEIIHDAARAAMAGAAGWAGSVALPIAMPLAGLVGAAAYEINSLATHVRTARDTPESLVLARLREEMEGGPVRLPEGY